MEIKDSEIQSLRSLLAERQPAEIAAVSSLNSTYRYPKGFTGFIADRYTR